MNSKLGIITLISVLLLSGGWLRRKEKPATPKETPQAAAAAIYALIKQKDAKTLVTTRLADATLAKDKKRQAQMINAFSHMFNNKKEHAQVCEIWRQAATSKSKPLLQGKEKNIALLRAGKVKVELKRLPNGKWGMLLRSGQQEKK